MKVKYLPSFIKDLKALKSTANISAIKKLSFEQILNYSSLQEVRNLKKLKAADNAYRIRVGDYRIGFFFEPPDTVIFSRVLHRSRIYNVFP